MHRRRQAAPGASSIGSEITAKQFTPRQGISSDPAPGDAGGTFGGGGVGGDGMPGGTRPPAGASLKPGCTDEKHTAIRQMDLHFNDALLADKNDPNHAHEWFGVIYEDDVGNVYFRDIGVVSQGPGGGFAVPTIAEWPGYTAIAWYHIHADTYNYGNGNGVQSDPNGAAYNTHFSALDGDYSASTGLTGYVAEHNDTGPVGSNQQTFQGYSYDPAAKTETKLGTLNNGSSSC